MYSSCPEGRTCKPFGIDRIPRELSGDNDGCIVSEEISGASPLSHVGIYRVLPLKGSI
jgi:hypothetical protein